MVGCRKRFALPMVGTRFGCLVASGRWAYQELSSTWEPSFRVGFEFKSGGAEMVHLNALRFKPKLFFKHIGLEASGAGGQLGSNCWFFTSG
jgi:hypothetical protein